MLAALIFAIFLVAETLLNRGTVTAQAIAGGGGTYTTDILINDRSTLTVQADMTGAANGDLTVVVTPFEYDNTTLLGIVDDPVRSKGPTFAAGRVTFWGEYDVQGFDKVRVTVTNANAGAQTITRLSWRLTG